jgi:hypothetical protein
MYKIFNQGLIITIAVHDSPWWPNFFDTTKNQTWEHQIVLYCIINVMQNKM